MKTLNSLLITLVIMAVFAGCGKDKDAEPDNLPTGKNWKITLVSLMDNNGSIIPVATAPSCDTDDIYRFRDDTTYVHEEGATKCDANHPQIVEQGTWAKVGNKFTWDRQEFDIEELNKQIFKIKANLSGRVVTITFTAQ